MRRLLVMTPYPSSQAATRFRLELFFSALRAVGIEPTLRPFLDEPGLRRLYTRGETVGKVGAAARALAGRLGDLVRAQRADAVLIHREAALVGPPLLEWLVARPIGKPIVYDVDDAVWVPYASPTYGARLSRLLKAPQKTHYTIAAAQHVLCGNAHLAEYVARFNPRVSILPTVVDTDAFRPAATRRAAEVPVLGWIGTHSSAPYLQAIVPALRRLAERRRFVVRVIGGRIDAPGVPVEHVAWSREREVADFQALDVGLYPLVEDAWSLGKSGFKAVQYMACAVPVVASPVGVTREMIRDGESGFLAATEDEWVERLGRLLDDAALRRSMGDAGRDAAVTRWSRAVHAPRFVAAIEGAIAAGGA